MVREGYKQTEVGVIPEGWEVLTVEDVCNEPMQNGVFYKPSLKGKGVKLINVGDLYENIPIDLDALELFDATDSEKSRFKVENGDLFFTRSSVVPSGIAQCNIYISNSEESVVFDSHVIRVRPNKKEIEPSYLFRFCVSPIARKYLVAHSKTATMTTIDQGVLGKCPVLVPTLAEQRAIAATLSDVDALIASLDKLIAKQRHLKTATMQQLLTGKKRLPGFGEGRGYQQTEVGVIPEDWDIKKLGQVLHIRHGKSQHEVVDPNGAYPILATGGEIGRTNTPLYSEPSVLIGRKGTIDIPYYMDTPFWTVDTLFYSEIFKNADPKFIFYKFNLIDWYSYNEASGVPSLNAATIENIDQAFPAQLEEQRAIATVLSDMDAAITALETRRAKTQAIKQGMMQQLLTGRVRLV